MTNIVDTTMTHKSSYERHCDHEIFKVLFIKMQQNATLAR